MFRSLVMVLALTLALVASSQSGTADVVPAVDLADMAPEHACYFLCYMCLEHQPVKLMDCVNSFCSTIQAGATCGPVLGFDMFRLGQQCPDLTDLTSPF